jgi:hypothetical protein
MPLSHELGPIVTVYNRQVDENGHRVPYDAFIDGQCITIKDSHPFPEGLARIIVHHSMYKMDPDTSNGEYRLGVKEWDLPVDDLKLAEIQRVELIERELLPPNRQFGAKDPKTGRRYQAVTRKQSIRRHLPMQQVSPRANEDGAHAGGFGEAYSR